MVRNATSGNEPAPPYQPLRDLVVVSVEQAVAAPLASRHLADLGARVIKVERPGSGDLARGYDRTVLGNASHFVWLNRGKESIELDLKDPDDAEVMRALVDQSDVVIQNLAPGAFARLGFGAAELRARRPGLITCDISGYGEGGPYETRKAYDLLLQCETGLVSITGTPDAPSKVGISIADIATGIYAFSGILSALYARATTGEGAAVEISMLEALGEWMGYPYYYSVYGGTPPPRAGASHATIAPYGPYVCGDGVTLNMGLQNDREWRSFCENFIGQPDLATDPRFAANADRVAHRADLDRLIASVFGELSHAEAADRLDAAQIAWATQRDVDSFATHPQLLARDRIAEINVPGGRVTALKPPINVRGHEHRLGDVPAVGAHSAAIRAWLRETTTISSSEGTTP